MENECESSGFNSLQLSATESMLTSSQYAKVIFHNVPEKYCSDQNLECQYTSLTGDFQCRFGDRIALFKLGWRTITEYELFEWAPIQQTNSKCTITFEACHLPKDPNEFYQFCYVNADNDICGASVPFQFIVPPSQTPSLPQAAQTNPVLSQDCTSCVKLKRQNDFLEKTLSHVNSALHKYDSEINVLKKDIDNLKLMLNGTQNEVSDFKTRLETAGDEFKKLYVEKKRVERKYEKLVKKCLESKKDVSLEDEFPGELAPLPAFPYCLQPL